MMVSEAVNESAKSARARQVASSRGSFLSRKIWLPKSLYNALPAFYIGAGLIALVATLYVSEWFWIVPHYLLFSAACIHMGLFIYRLRRHR